jgi:hypothetical protein
MKGGDITGNGNGDNAIPNVCKMFPLRQAFNKQGSTISNNDRAKMHSSLQYTSNTSYMAFFVIDTLVALKLIDYRPKYITTKLITLRIVYKVRKYFPCSSLNTQDVGNTFQINVTCLKAINILDHVLCFVLLVGDGGNDIKFCLSFK